MQRISKTFIISALLFLPFSVYGNVIINEIAWMGTNVSYNDEWIELYNNGGSTVNLDGWILRADDGTPEINLSGIIPAKGFYLLERTNDDTVLGISADLIYTGALGNNGENLKLYDNKGSLIDQVNCIDAWLAGDNSTKQTMERIDSNWQTSQQSGGTPKAKNSQVTKVTPPPPEKTQEPELIKPEFEPIIIEKEKPIEDGPLYVYAEGVVFNEILPSPDGPDAENEWIEIYNENDFEIDLFGWTIQDTAGSTKTYTLNVKITGLGYLVFLRPETKITLNNDGDGLTFMDPNGEIIDSVSFGKASLGQSYNRTESGWAWSTTLTPGEKNIIPIKKSSTPTKSTEQKLSKAGAQTVEEDISSISDINPSTQKSKSYVFLIAFIIALLSSIAFLIIKNNLKSFWY